MTMRRFSWTAEETNTISDVVELYDIMLLILHMKKFLGMKKQAS